MCCRFCHTPASVGAFVWDDDITKWPVSRPICIIMYVNVDNYYSYLPVFTVGHHRAPNRVMVPRVDV